MVSFCVYNYCPRKQPKRPGPMTGGCLRRLVIKLTGLTEFFCHFLLYFLSAILRLHGVTIFRTWGYWTYIVSDPAQSPHKPYVPVYHVRGPKLFLTFTQNIWLRVKTMRPVAAFSAMCQIFISMSTQRSQREHPGRMRNTQEDFSKFLTSNEVKHWNETQRERSATKTNTTLNVSNRVWKDFREI